jgi:hypothetical protein
MMGKGWRFVPISAIVKARKLQPPLLACAMFLCATVVAAQGTPAATAGASGAAAASVAAASIKPIELVVPKGTPLRVSLVKKVPIRKVGDPVVARVLEPVYSFDRVAVPAGSRVTGKVTKIVPATKLRRTEAILNGDFTPLKTLKIEFDTLILKNGTRMPLETSVSPAITEVVRLVSRPGKHPSLVAQAKEAIDQEWRAGIHQLKAPGKLHRLKELAASELPYHHQALAAGTVYDAELEKSLDCGAAALAPGELAHVGQIPPANSIVEARLLTPLSSATAHKGTPVEAVITKPVFSPKKKELLLPVGTKLEGEVVRARAARRLHRNGKLRFVIRKMELPSGLSDRIDASIEGLEVGKSQNLALDSEGGASVKESKKRFLTTALSVAVATASLDLDSGKHVASQSGDASTRGIAGGSGFRLIGLALGLGVQSRTLGSVLGFLGAGRSVYYHFIGRGKNVVLPKDTPMEIAFGSHVSPTGN